ncbi:UDP-N-acetylglucosamine-N-acetylmuramyl-pyrophosphoryl-undecaprenol N-acetylglucosamine protein [Quillaja saponaria]|uniref:UDP-N-acetylglucosamine-N-acetylmuramyl-pyrophosphoryl-undecaprenol N-acetylglucosamine protein n=1 Tax=Quillaja saponaria TaxID=32244 RepID=A0AAD7Q4F2_QUISA|nr:UDP-N-acetylglucosamine-N-acetylmuramyl-pyrophosphoryl-undecaprenol N-acetylglucosamine protein [Quillaja saponaria]
MQLQVTTDTTTLSYWLNWRVFLCAIWVLLPMVIASLMIWKYEGSRNLKSEEGEIREIKSWMFCGDEAWKPCIKEIHPICLLVFRVTAFSLLLVTLIAKIVINGGAIFYYYTQWTFTLVTIYFGCASLLSLYGCYQYQAPSSRRFNVSCSGRDAEQGSSTPLLHQDSRNMSRMGCASDANLEIPQAARVWSYIFQILFQINAGAVVLTDSVYWFIVFPFLTIKDYDLNFMTVNMHTLNAVLLLGDTALNCLRVPWFRISFFVLWTGIFVIFQWIIHACVPIWWPYPFLELSSNSAPLWYLLVALMHIPCYGLFMLIVDLKHYLLSKWFPMSYQC